MSLNQNLYPAWPGKLLDLHYSNPATLISKELGFNPEGSDTSPSAESLELQTDNK